MSTQQQTGLVISKSAVVSATPERAFEVFTEEIATWWPYKTHSVEGSSEGDTVPQTVVFETGPNGRVYEIMSTGEEAHWANVGVWDPPHRFLLEWKVNPNAAATTEVEVRFTPEGDGTRVDLEHRGFERLGDAAETTHESYSSGWPTVVQAFVDSLSK
jgi:Activator of Hsp90 ATPase homolog 1-like protein